ncbi:proteophosphoglycan 5 [Moniliophthora roreri MCA 2997]|uniref:Proteophosphoglycan 5 n=1 Tax=Moniliophthora roreri (strain MCA 2997) TaxID=1381753 RepID=V2X209_MONRO|nr:proteophosphoglycan 5 [Moniliophthora roreri MCA 2997]
MSRAAWQAAHALVREGDISAAILVLHSARLSQVSDMESWCPKNGQVSDMFPKPVSPRLCGHAIIHDLLRRGLQQKAFRLAQNLLDDGVKLHRKTLETVVEGVLHSSGRLPTAKAEFLTRMKIILAKGQCIDTNRLASMSAHPGTRCAIQIMENARRRNHERTENMFSAVIKACLLQGELLAATLLFATMVKEWTLRDALSKREDSDATRNLAGTTLQQESGRRRPKVPDTNLMISILSSIMDVLGRKGKHAADDLFEVSFQEALQALAHLGWLLDWRQFIWGEAGGLIRALYSCPTVENLVFVFDLEENGFKRVKASDYFRHVLKRLIKDPPHGSPTSNDPSANWHFGSPRQPVGTRSRMPPLCRHSCNALLHFALHRQKSQQLASKVLAYMKHIHIAPDIVTLNILIAAGTRLRDPAISESALSALRVDPENAHLTEHIFSAITRTIPAPSHSPLHQVNESLEAKAPLKADSFTINSYIAHLVATGRVELVSKLVFRLLPELHVVDHPSWGSATPEEIKQYRWESRTDCIRRVVSYGPYFIVSLLSALRKAGQTGLVERVWMLGKEAERASWVPGFCEGTEPWLLPVHAYTVMISCYADEVEKRWWKRLPLTEEEHKWVPRRNSKVRGWARFILSSRRREKTHRFSAGKIGGVTIYKAMMSGIRSVYDDLLRLQNGRHHFPELPKPDLRFFNAMLRITTRHPKMMPRNPYTPPSHWKQHLRFANWIYARFGSPRQYPNAMIETVVEDMLEAGYQIPLGMQYLLVGRSPRHFGGYQATAGVMHGKRRYKFHAFQLPAQKSKGLLLRRKFTLRRHHRTSKVK